MLLRSGKIIDKSKVTGFTLFKEHVRDLFKIGSILSFFLLFIPMFYFKPEKGFSQEAAFWIGNGFAVVFVLLLILLITGYYHRDAKRVRGDQS